MKLKKQMISVVLVLILLLTMNVAVFAAHPFEDVSGDSWYNEAVDYVYENELMSGTGSNSFGPNVNMSRAMLVTVLYRLAGSPSAEAVLPFVDVASDAYYFVPVMWCYSNGIVAGTSENTFSPDVNITREQMVAIFAKYAAYKGLSTEDTLDLGIYKDKSEIAAYAVDAFAWAVKNGIISGTSATTLSPQSSATRAQCAVVIQRFIEWTEHNNPTITPPSTSPVTPPDVELTPLPTVKPTSPPTWEDTLPEDEL